LGAVCIFVFGAMPWHEVILAQSSPADLQISRTRIDFGNQAVGSLGPAQAITMNNAASSTVNLILIITSGIDFSQKNDCGQALAPGAQCTIHVLFKPATIGERIGNLNISGSDSGSPHFIVLNGTGE
jgi:hypothetical protein